MRRKPEAVLCCGYGREMGRGHATPEQAALEAALLPLPVLTERIISESARVAELGAWPAHISLESISHRIPQGGEHEASGFDAGVACTLDLIPREKQQLAASLHAAYTPEAVERVRREVALGLHPDFESAWWLAACSVCIESGVTEEVFRAQLAEFSVLAADARSRHTAAKSCLDEMRSLYSLRNGVPHGEADGCMQGAYLDGYDLATSYDPEHDLYFIGTFRPSLGLEEFAWSADADSEGRNRSGPVWGSAQFCKAGSTGEFEAAVDVARAHLGV